MTDALNIMNKMKVFFHPDFYSVYTSDPAATAGRMEAVVSEIREFVTFAEAIPAALPDIQRVHT